MLRVNDRCKGTQYFDTEAAADVLGSINKIELTSSPFIHTFEFSGTNGYWTGNHTIIQIEDCIVCLVIKVKSYFFLTTAMGIQKREPMIRC